MLVFENRNEIGNFKQSMDQAQKEVNNAVGLFNELPLAKIKTIDQLNDLFTNPEQLFIDMLPLQKDQKLFGITIKPSKAIELLEIDTKPILSALDAIDKRLVFEFIGICKATAKGFVIDKDRLEKRLDPYRIYATTEREIAIATVYEAMREQAEKLISLGAAYDPEHWFKYQAGQLTIDPQFYSRLVR